MAGSKSRLVSARAKALAVCVVAACVVLPTASAGALTAAPGNASVVALDSPNPTVGIDPSDSAAVLAAWRSIIADSPPMGFNGNLATCNAGTTSYAYKQAELTALNAIRSLSGVQPVALNPAWNPQAQQAAMLMAVNQRLDHNPVNTTSATWQCLDALGQAGARTSNLFLGYVGADTLWGYVADWGASNVDVGHRRWVLCPGSTQVGFGDVPAPAAGKWPANAMKVFDGSTVTPDGPSRDGYVAWPNPGLVPLNYAGPYGMLDRFSLQVPTYLTTAGASVTVTSDTRGAIGIASTHTDDLAYCQPVVEWEPALMPNYGETWTITVSGLSDGTTTENPFTYQVHFVDLSASTPFVRAAFQDFIGRAPSSTESTSWTRGIDADSANGTYASARGELVTTLSTSPEWVANLLTGFYEETLGRKPDPGGLAYWTSLLSDGERSVTSVASYFYASQEYFDRSGGTTGAWVDALYQQLLGRPADPGGRANWVARAAAIGRGGVAAAFYQSLESRRARVTELYQDLLGRKPDPAGLAYWADRLLTAGDLQLAASLASSDEYDQRAWVRFPS